MAQQIVIGIVSVIVLGVGAQWLAWRFKVPSILLLLVFGFLAGPVTELLPPESLQGDWLSAFVSLSIGIILFEGGLSLRLKELQEVGKAVLNLITIGVLVTWVLAAAAAYYIADFSLSMAIQIGAILTVTGPTVVIPLLRHVRPTGRIGAVAKWEGITIDPVGAILSVLVLEAIILLNQSVEIGQATNFGGAVLHAVEGLLLTIFISVGVSVLGAALLIVLLYRRLVPDFLQSSVALMIVVGTFALANVLQEEAGLLEVTLMGTILANQKYVPVRRISEFKEDLQVLLLGFLFILLSARLELSTLQFIDERALLFLAVLVLLVRPLAVMLSSINTRLTWKEQAFLAWLAPRGIVAAAVASLFALRLQTIFPVDAERLVPVVFLVIVGTVAIYGLTISPLARYLGLAHPNPQGVLVLGAHTWAQEIARALRDLGFQVLLIDSNPTNVEQARRNGLPAQLANALSETVIDELELGGIGRLLALTPNDEVNSLAALHFSEIFESTDVYQLAARPESRDEGQSLIPRHLRGRPLFGLGVTHVSLSQRFSAGGEVRTVQLSENLTYEDLQERYRGEGILLFVVRGQELLIHSEEGQLAPVPGDTVVIFAPPIPREVGLADEVAFEQLVTRAFVIDLKGEATYKTISTQAAGLLSERLAITVDELTDGFLAAARYGAIPISRGAALSHYRISGIDQPELVMVRCQSGLCLRTEEESETWQEPPEPVYAIFFLVSPEDNPGQHLRTLANMASRIDDRWFRDRWREASDEQQLKEALLHPDRFVSLYLDEGDQTADFIGKSVGELELPVGSAVALVRRNGQVIVPDEETRLEEGDRITITGDISTIRQLYGQYQEGVRSASMG